MTHNISRRDEEGVTDSNAYGIRAMVAAESLVFKILHYLSNIFAT